MNKKNESTVPIELEIATMPDLDWSGPVPISPNLPPRNRGEESYFWKFKNENPDVRYDFWLIVSIQKKGHMMMVTQLIPLADGGLLRTVRYHEYQVTMNNTYIKIIKSTHGNYGVVKTSRLKIKEYYEGILHTLFISKVKVYRYDAKGKEVEEPVTPSYTFPPLPSGTPDVESASPRYRVDQLEARDINTRSMIYFPVCKKVSVYDEEKKMYVEDYEVDGGVEESLPGDGMSVGAETRHAYAPGFYYEVAEQGGSPSLILNLGWQVDTDGKPHFVFGSCCTGYSYHQIHQQVFVKKKRSWFRKKKKISIIRKELKIEGVKYYDI